MGLLKKVNPNRKESLRRLDGDKLYIKEILPEVERYVFTLRAPILLIKFYQRDH